MNEYLVQWMYSLSPTWETTIHHPSHTLALKHVQSWADAGYFQNGARVSVWEMPAQKHVATFEVKQSFTLKEVYHG